MSPLAMSGRVSRFPPAVQPFAERPGPHDGRGADGGRRRNHRAGRRRHVHCAHSNHGQLCVGRCWFNHYRCERTPMKTHPRYSFPLYLSNVSLITGNSVWDAVEPIIIDARTHTWKHAPHPPREPPALNPVKKNGIPHSLSSRVSPFPLHMLPHPPCAPLPSCFSIALVLLNATTRYNLLPSCAIHVRYSLSICHTSPCATPLPVPHLSLCHTSARPTLVSSGGCQLLA
eukprot:351185-Chlamydomonas_euryale.AAC.2